jgi:hypothetical protein
MNRSFCFYFCTFGSSTSVLPLISLSEFLIKYTLSLTESSEREQVPDRHLAPGARPVRRIVGGGEPASPDCFRPESGPGNLCRYSIGETSLK